MWYSLVYFDAGLAVWFRNPAVNVLVGRRVRASSLLLSLVCNWLCFLSCPSSLFVPGSSTEMCYRQWTVLCPRTHCTPGPMPALTSKGKVPTCLQIWTTRWKLHVRRCFQMFLFLLHKFKLLHILKLWIYMTNVTNPPDCDEGERSAGMAEEVRRQPAGSGGDEVRAVTTLMLQIHYSMSRSASVQLFSWSVA